MLLKHCDAEYKQVPSTPLILSEAVRLTQAHRLRGYDAVQLAAALSAHRSLVAAGLSGLVFVAAAQVEGLAADNPNRYP